MFWGWDGARAVAGSAGKWKGRPEGRPEDWKAQPALLALDTELGMGYRDVFWPALERRVFRRLKPFEREFALIEPLDGGQPEAFEFAFLVPTGCEHPRADSKRFPRVGRGDCVLGLAGRC